MKKLLLMGGLVTLLAAAHGASFAATHHAVKAKVRVLAAHAKAPASHPHVKATCPSTPKCECD